MLKITKYNEVFLSKSWDWLNDEEIRELTMTPYFTKKDQLAWYESLKHKTDYIIWGIIYEGFEIGVCGIKNINHESAEYWGYIGEKQYWNKGLSKLILENVCQFSKSKGLVFLWLKVDDKNIRAIKAYEKFGFVYKTKEDNVLKYEIKL